MLLDWSDASSDKSHLKGPESAGASPASCQGGGQQSGAANEKLPGQVSSSVGRAITCRSLAEPWLLPVSEVTTTPRAEEKLRGGFSTNNEPAVRAMGRIVPNPKGQSTSPRATRTCVGLRCQVPTEPRNQPNQTKNKPGQDRTRTKQKPPRHTNPLLHLLPTPESLPKTCSRISSVAVSPLIRTEHLPTNCLQSCSAVKTSLRISTSRGPSCHLSASARPLESAVSLQLWTILRFPARIANFFSCSGPQHHLNTLTMHVACQAGPLGCRPPLTARILPGNLGSAVLSVGPPWGR